MRKRSLTTGLILVVCLAITVAAAWAQSSASFDLSWHVIGGGGGPAASVHYGISSTVGQWVASPPYSFSRHYAASSGYWFGEGPTISGLYLPLVLKSFSQ